jgi:molybdopterin/thiamine biosynthesis adenylyltransferase
MSMPPTTGPGVVVDFDYTTAFSRNIGWLTRAEQDKIRDSRIAIAGLGGVGGAHVLSLLRLGIGALNISDFDRFSIENFNRQAGATLTTVGLPKINCIARMARDINPSVSLRCFERGITNDNLDDFLDGVDIYVDGIDFFAVDVRRKLFAACERKGIRALTAAPLGMGTALLYFKPGEMTFEDYFRLEGQSRFEQLVRFVAGLSPAMLQRDYLVVPSAVNFPDQRGPSTVMACDLCAGVVGTEVLKLLLGRGHLRPAPWGMQFDAYSQKLSHTWRPFGNANPLQQLLLMLIRRKLKGN